MGRRNQIDVVTAEVILKIKHPSGKGFEVNFVPLLVGGVLAYLVVLAIDASHVAVAEEDCPGATRARQDRFLAVVGAI